jgi:sulfate transport system permease protein
MPRTVSILPGFRLTLGVTMFGLSSLLLLPLAALFARTSSIPFPQLLEIVTDPRAVASYRLTLLASLAAASLNGILGFIVAWTLVRVEFPGRRLLDAFVDLPFALPTAVSGIALTAIYSKRGWLGSILAPLGIETAFSPLGIVIALTFITLPFVVRTLQPAIEDLDPAVEEAAEILGASPAQTFLHIVLPSLFPALLTGFALAFARALGEYGSVIFIAGNMPMRTEITSLLIVTKLEQFDYSGAAALGAVQLCAAFLLLFSINLIQWWASRRKAPKEN